MSDRKLPWESEEPVKNVYGFCAAAGNIKIYLGFAMYRNGQVMVYALESIGGAETMPWRRVWTGPESAVDTAEEICCDIEEYLEPLVMKRPAEDLDMDDFLECLHLYCTGMLH